MVGIKNKTVLGLYTNSKGFEANGVNYGDVGVTNDKINIKYYFDKYENNKVHACLIAEEESRYWGKGYDKTIFEAQEMENFDTTNAFRANYGLNALKIDDIAIITARKHSQDMADKNYFDQTNLEGLSLWDSYINNGGKNFGSGENISAGRLLGIESFDGWLNSEGHRKNMLGNHNYLGVGFGYNKSADYYYYLTQFFSS